MQVKGMRDFYPADYAVIRRLQETWTGVGKSAGYEEFEAPMLEPVELYLGKSSEELVKDQSYQVIDRKGRVLLLRPELTPSLARMIARKERELAFPVRWQSFGLFFRYERPQKGRTRAFYQWNLDLIGADSMLADLEVLLLAQKSLETLGLTPDDVSIRVNSRRILSEALEKRFAVPAALVPMLLPILDRLERTGRETTAEGLTQAGVPQGTADDIIEYMQSAEWSAEPWLAEIESLLAAVNAVEWFEPDFRIIRGLDYYNGLVFEAWAKRGMNRAIFGGGRYDGLSNLVGSSKALPAVGFAIGDVAITELLRECALLRAGAGDEPDVLVTIFDDGCRSASIGAWSVLMTAGIRAELYPAATTKLAKQLDYARKKGIRFVVIIGPDERQSKTAVLKNMDAGRQVTMPVSELATAILPPSR
jgi:histidyl-tRNA synthetase